jgi:hypothetical protein
VSPKKATIRSWFRSLPSVTQASTYAPAPPVAQPAAEVVGGGGGLFTH